MIRHFMDIERDRMQNRLPLPLVALYAMDGPGRARYQQPAGRVRTAGGKSAEVSGPWPHRGRE
jgi:hypothetical protein